MTSIAALLAAYVNFQADPWEPDQVAGHALADLLDEQDHPFAAEVREVVTAEVRLHRSDMDTRTETVTCVPLLGRDWLVTCRMYGREDYGTRHYEAAPWECGSRVGYRLLRLYADHRDRRGGARLGFELDTLLIEGGVTEQARDDADTRAARLAGGLLVHALLADGQHPLDALAAPLATLAGHRGTLAAT